MDGPTKEELSNRIEKFIEANAHLPKQRTEGWLEFKKTTIGGSQMATLMEINEYETLEGLVASKVGLPSRKFTSTIKTQWGTLFEDVLRKYVEHDKKTTVMGDQLLIQNCPNVSYSPDGLGVVTLPVEREVTEADGTKKTITVHVPRSVLFEFKCPFNRIPHGEVPTYYTPQVKTGLEVIPVVECALFAEAVFRRCSWEDLGPGPKRDRTLVDRSSGRTPVAYGFIGFYSTKSDWTGEYEFELQDLETSLVEQGFEINDTNDFGELDPKLFTKVMALFDKHCVHPWYGSTVHCNGTTPDRTSEELDQFVLRQQQEGNYVWGVLPWKLFRVDYHIIEPTRGYLDAWRFKIDEVIGVVRKCLENPAKKLEIFNEYFKKGEASNDDGFVYED